MSQNIPFRHVSILGVGLLGGSIGLALRRAGFAGRITGFGHRQSSLQAAVDAGCIDSGTLDLAEAVAGADLVVLCSPVALFEKLFGQLAEIWASGIGHRASGKKAFSTAERPVSNAQSPTPVTVTDVGSTKRQVVAWAKKLLPGNVRFVGSHPIAGSEKRGPQYARADLFDGACCVVTVPNAKCPVPREKHSSPRPDTWGWTADFASAIDSVESLWQSLGMWTVRMSPTEHDRSLAEISHLPHATAAALMLLSNATTQDLAGGGFLDSTRIAGGDPVLWRDIFLTNGPQVVRAIRRFNSKLDRLARLIETNDDMGLVRYLASAQRRRMELMERRLKRSRVEG